ncbi:hypothetical protein AVEN_202932-1, partial [Araneus ventricosus]
IMAEKHSDVLTIDDEEEEAVLEEKEKDLLEQSPSVEDTEKKEYLGCGGLMEKFRLHGWWVQCSKSDFTEDSPCM